MPTDTQTRTAANVVQSTDNYDQFSFIGNNREVSRGHVESIKKSLEDNGNFTEAQPILVNERFQIIDGQHRFVACQELGLPVFFTVVPGIGIREALQMNILHKGWTALDYLRTYAEGGNRTYQKLAVIVEEYPDFAFTVLLAYAYDGERSGLFKRFRQGELDDFDINEARERLDKLVELQTTAPDIKLKSLARAFLKVMHVDGYRQARMIEKVGQLSNEIRNYQAVEDNLRQLEYVYNWHVTERGYLRFF